MRGRVLSARAFRLVVDAGELRPLTLDVLQVCRPVGRPPAGACRFAQLLAMLVTVWRDEGASIEGVVEAPVPIAGALGVSKRTWQRGRSWLLERELLELQESVDGQVVILPGVKLRQLVDARLGQVRA